MQRLYKRLCFRYFEDDFNILHTGNITSNIEWIIFKSNIENKRLLCIWDNSVRKLYIALHLHENIKYIYPTLKGSDLFHKSLYDKWILPNDIIMMITNKPSTFYMVNLKKDNFLPVKYGCHSDFINGNDDLNQEYLTIFNKPSAALEKESHVCLHDSHLCNKIQVSCAKFCPSLKSLICGYTCGHFEIWNMYLLQLDYENFSLNLSTRGSIKQISFQEPENDPRSLFYIWLSCSNDQDSQYPATINMYQLLYASKSRLPHNDPQSSRTSINVYNDLVDCQLYMRIDVEALICQSMPYFICTNLSNDLAPTYRCKLISMYSYQDMKTDSVISDQIESFNNVDFHDDRDNLFFFIAELTCNESEICSDFIEVGRKRKCENMRYSERVKETFICTGVFDINQWYNCRMPCLRTPYVDPELFSRDYLTGDPRFRDIFSRVLRQNNHCECLKINPFLALFVGQAPQPSLDLNFEENKSIKRFKLSESTPDTAGEMSPTNILEVAIDMDSIRYPSQLTDFMNQLHVNPASISLTIKVTCTNFLVHFFRCRSLSEKFWFVLERHTSLDLPNPLLKPEPYYELMVEAGYNESKQVNRIANPSDDEKIKELLDVTLKCSRYQWLLELLRSMHRQEEPLDKDCMKLVKLLNSWITEKCGDIMAKLETAHPPLVNIMRVSPLARHKNHSVEAIKDSTNANELYHFILKFKMLHKILSSMVILNAGQESREVGRQKLNELEGIGENKSLKDAFKEKLWVITKFMTWLKTLEFCSNYEKVICNGMASTQTDLSKAVSITSSHPPTINEDKNSYSENFRSQNGTLYDCFINNAISTEDVKSKNNFETCRMLQNIHDIDSVCSLLLNPLTIDGNMRYIVFDHSLCKLFHEQSAKIYGLGTDVEKSLTNILLDYLQNSHLLSLLLPENDLCLKISDVSHMDSLYKSIQKHVLPRFSVCLWLLDSDTNLDVALELLIQCFNQPFIEDVFSLTANKIMLDEGQLLVASFLETLIDTKMQESIYRRLIALKKTSMAYKLFKLWPLPLTTVKQMVMYVTILLSNGQIKTAIQFIANPIKKSENTILNLKERRRLIKHFCEGCFFLKLMPELESFISKTTSCGLSDANKHFLVENLEWYLTYLLANQSPTGPTSCAWKYFLDSIKVCRTQSGSPYTLADRREVTCQPSSAQHHLILNKKSLAHDFNISHLKRLYGLTHTHEAPLVGQSSLESSNKIAQSQCPPTKTELYFLLEWKNYLIKRSSASIPPSSLLQFTTFHDICSHLFHPVALKTATTNEGNDLSKKDHLKLFPSRNSITPKSILKNTSLSPFSITDCNFDVTSSSNSFDITSSLDSPVQPKRKKIKRVYFSGNIDDQLSSDTNQLSQSCLENDMPLYHSPVINSTTTEDLANTFDNHSDKTDSSLKEIVNPEKYINLRSSLEKSESHLTGTSEANHFDKVESPEGDIREQVVFQSETKQNVEQGGGDHKILIDPKISLVKDVVLLKGIDENSLLSEVNKGNECDIFSLTSSPVPSNGDFMSDIDPDISPTSYCKLATRRRSFRL